MCVVITVKVKAKSYSTDKDVAREGGGRINQLNRRDDASLIHSFVDGQTRQIDVRSGRELVPAAAVAYYIVETITVLRRR